MMGPPPPPPTRSSSPSLRKERLHCLSRETGYMQKLSLFGQLWDYSLDFLLGFAFILN